MMARLRAGNTTIVMKGRAHIMNKLFIGLVAGFMLGGVLVTFQPSKAQVDQTPESQDYVPHTPTGCPYGDSIPVDSPKCVPPPEEQPTPSPTAPVTEPVSPQTSAQPKAVKGCEK